MTRFFKVIHYLYSGLDILFPPQCAGCKCSGYRWCPDCIKKSPKVAEIICPHCGMPNVEKNICYYCQQHPPSFKAARAWGLHVDPLRQAVHQLKYRRDIALGEILSISLLDLIQTQNWNINLIVPIPLAKKRLRQRGYNQAVLLAYPLAWHLGIEYSTKALIRNRETRTQIGLTKKERRENVRNVFSPDSYIIRGKKILLVDDVITTGATLDSASEALLRCGAEAVYAVTLARAASLLQK